MELSHPPFSRRQGSERLSQADLLRVLDAIRAMADACTAPELDRVLPKLLEIAARATDSDRSAIFLIDVEHDELVLAGDWPGTPELAARYRRMPAGRTQTGALVRSLTARAFHARDLAADLAAAGFVECAIVPLELQGRPAGSLHLVRNTPRPYQDDELRAAEILAAQLAVQLESARLYSESQRRIHDLSLINEVGRAMTASLELDRILVVSAGILTRVIDASNSFILLLDEESGELRGVATSNELHSEQFRTVRIAYDAPSIAARCARTGTTIAIDDAVASAEVSKALVELYGEKSLLALPLMVQGVPIGAVVIDDTRAIRSWTRSEIERAEVIAHQVAAAVANARLFEDLKQSYGELARAQEELVKRERLAALGELAAVMAHEVRNPLGVIFNSLGTLARILRPTADAALLLDIVREEAVRLNHLVGDLLDFARPNPPAMHAESLQAVIDGAIEAATSVPGSSGVRVVTEVATDVPPVEIDARMIRRALLNLVSNGLQAMSAGGVLTVRASAELRGDRRVARVDVIDEGPGIDPEVVPRMFEPFFTTKASGTGLGLAVVKSIVEAHRGELSVESRPGAGTTFTLRLPLVKEVVAPAPGW